MLEGWKREGETLTKWFGDHYKEAANETVAAELDREHGLRQEGAANAARAAATDLRATADVVDPDTDTTPAPSAEAPAEAPAEIPAEAPADAATTEGE